MGLIIKWTNIEIDFLKNYYSDMGAKYCENNLNRSITAIRRKANLLNLIKHTDKNKYTKENLSKLVYESKNIQDILNKLNMRIAGGNYNTINKYIKLYNLDISHFVKAIDILNNNKKKLTYNDLFVENCIHSRSTLKRYILIHNIIDYKCNECKQTEIWRNKKLSLILDHINGIHNDNRIENLRFVCPNCNATLDTHCGKNRICVSNVKYKH